MNIRVSVLLLALFSGLVSCRKDSPRDPNASSGSEAASAAASTQPATWQDAPGFSSPEDAEAHVSFSCRAEDLWSGTLSDTLLVEIQSQLQRASLEDWLRNNPDLHHSFLPTFLSGFVLGGKPVGCQASLVSERYGDAKRRIFLSPDFVRAASALPDTTLTRVATALDSSGFIHGSLRDVLEKALFARYVLDRYPQLSRGLEFVRKCYLHFDRQDEGGLIGLTHNDSLGTAVSELPEYFAFWIDRKEDGTMALAEESLHGIINRLYPGSIHPERLKARAASLFREEGMDRKNLSAVPVFFDTNSFIDPSIPPDSSALDIRRKLLRTHIVASALALGTAWLGVPEAYQEGQRVENEDNQETERVFEGEELSRALFGSGSRCFRKDLEYFGLFKLTEDSGFAWEILTLEPKMSITGYGWDDGIYDIGLRLRVIPGLPGKVPVLFAGLPSRRKGGAAPSGGRPIPRASRTVEVSRDSGFCRVARETFAMPEGMGKVRELFTLTYYQHQPYARGYIADLPGQEREGLVFRNPDRPVTADPQEEEGMRSPDTTADDLLQASASLFAVTSAQDTVLLHQDHARGGMGDGETAYSQAARCRFPVALDADGDGLTDLMVETASGQVLFLQKEDGNYTLAHSNDRPHPKRQL